MTRSMLLNWRSGMLLLGAAALSLGLCLGGASPIRASQSTHEAGMVGFASPERALLSPAGGHLEVAQQLIIHNNGDMKSVSFILPGEAVNLHLDVAGHSVVRWSSSPLVLSRTSEHYTRRMQILREKDEAAANLETIKSRIAVWKTQIPDATTQEIALRQSQMQDDLPPLVLKQQELERQLRLLDLELGKMPASAGIGQLVNVIIAGNGREGQKVDVSYSYDLPGCGWNAYYDFDAMPDEKGDSVNVSLLAEVWQYTGMDWKDTRITLATRGSGEREPLPLPEWVIGSERPKPQPRAAVFSAKAMSVGMDNGEAAHPQAAVTGDVESVYATWTLGAPGLPEGRSRIKISGDSWKTPLSWLARPARGDSRVWLMAKYRLPDRQAWPAGAAQFSVNGQNIGSGTFSPDNGYATLYFGADPRVNVRTTVDSNRQGETGIINTSRTWTWGWTYTVSNEHNKAVKVRVERPEPIITNESVSVSCDDKPASARDDKEHVLYWEIDVPAHGRESIQHQVTVRAPIKLDLSPAAP